MKKILIFTLILAMQISLLTGCASEKEPSLESSPESSIETNEKSEEETEESTEPMESTEEESSEEESSEEEPDAAAEPAELAIEAADANNYNSIENLVPLGEWVYYSKKNYYAEKNVPHYVRIVSVTRDPDAVAAALEEYQGIWDLTLTEDQARDIEYGLVEYEVYYAPDYEAATYGISYSSPSLRAASISGGFRTDGGSSYIGIGSSYELDPVGSGGEDIMPGDTVTQKALFSILIDYDESEYVFGLDWYEGEIEMENARHTYFSAM